MKTAATLLLSLTLSISFVGLAACGGDTKAPPPKATAAGTASKPAPASNKDAGAPAPKAPGKDEGAGW